MLYFELALKSHIQIHIAQFFLPILPLNFRLA